jgi:hypothetical protein
MSTKNLWNNSVPRVELDQRARDARLRLDQIERLAVPPSAEMSSSFGRRSITPQPRQNLMEREDERRLPLPLIGLSTAEAAATLLIGADRPQEIDLAEGRPQHVGEIELTVGALP